MFSLVSKLLRSCSQSFVVGSNGNGWTRATRPLAVEGLEDRRLLTSTLNPYEQLLLELVNRARATPELEARRFNVGLNDGVDADSTISTTQKQPLAPNEFLTNAARFHAFDMLNHDYFAHEGLDGSTPTERANRFGYPADAGENIAWWGHSRQVDPLEQTFLRHEALFLSPGHRVNLMTSHYREAGMGILLGEFEGLNAIMVAEEFGNQGGNAFITGVAYTDFITSDRFYTVGEGIGSLTITAVQNGTGEVFTTTTGDAGGYSLRVPNGIYTVTASGVGLPQSQTAINVFISNRNQKVDFNARTSSFANVTGVAYNDVDRDGNRDGNEAGIGGITFYIDMNNNGQLDEIETSVTSNSSGNYAFRGLIPGSYKLRQQVEAPWMPTVPSDGFDVSILLGASLSNIDFGSRASNEFPIANDDVFNIVADQADILGVYDNDQDPGANSLATNSIVIVRGPTNGNTFPQAMGGVIYQPNDGFVGTDSFDYTISDTDGLVSNVATVTINVEAPTFPWQNASDPLDVNNDRIVTALDVLVIVNLINDVGVGRLPEPSGSNTPPPFVDVSGDNNLSALDAVMIVNKINEDLSAEGESATSAAVSSSVSPASFAVAIDAYYADEEQKRRRSAASV